MRIAFLYNHSSAHQVPHTAPFALALSSLNPEIEVVLAYSSPAEHAMLQRIAGQYPGHRCRFHALTLPPLYRLVDPLVSAFTFESKKQILKHNLAFFRSCDALVSPELTCLRLKSVHGLTHLQMILAPHGAGDRAVGYDPRIAEFDHVLVPGEKTFDRMRREGCISEQQASVVGYAKFAALSAPSPQRFFANDRPTVLYNPHFQRGLSSWHSAGRELIEHFSRRHDYNLIVAPHVILFKRYLRHRAWLPRRRFAAHVLIDRGSERSIDMSYTCAADIYIGDVSSQVYEFIYHPRPCIFINSQSVDWQDDPNYAHWHLGEVIERIDQLAPALARAQSLFASRYQARQRAAIADTFAHAQQSDSVAEHGAQLIARLLQSHSRESSCLSPAVKPTVTPPESQHQSA